MGGTTVVKSDGTKSQILYFGLYERENLGAGFSAYARDAFVYPRPFPWRRLSCSC